MLYEIDDLLIHAQKPIDEFLRWSHLQSGYKHGYDRFIAEKAEERNPLFELSSRRECIAEIKQNIIMYRWLYNNLADSDSKEVLKALVARRLFGTTELEQYADSAYAEIINPLVKIDTLDAMAYCGGNVESLLTFADMYPDKKVYYYEPDIDIFYIAEKKLRRFKNVIAYPCGAFNRSAQFKYINGKTADFIPLDEYINEKLSCVILNNNGLELYAIEGMRGHMQKCPPVVAADVSFFLDAVWQVPYRIKLMRPSYDLYLRYDGKRVALYALPGGNTACVAKKSADAPKVTVFTCAYNTPEHKIRRAIESVISQTYRDFEYIIIDNGCTDETSNIIREYAEAHHQIRLFRLERNSIDDAWHLMLEEAKGEFLVILDSDDYYEPHFLQVMVDEQSRTGADIVACSTRGESYDTPFGRGIRSFKTTQTDLKGLGDIWPDVFGLLSTIWAKLLKLSIYRSVKTDLSAGTGNDTLYCLLYLKQCRVISISEYVLHVYIQARKTVSREFNPYGLQRDKIIFAEANRFLASTGTLSERNYAYNCTVFISSVKRSVRFATEASDVPINERIMFIEDILDDEDIRKAAIFLKQAGPFYTEIVDAQRQIAESGRDGEALLLADARKDMLEGNNGNALKKLLKLAGKDGPYGKRAINSVSRIYKGHQLLKAYEPWMAGYPDIVSAVFTNEQGKAIELLTERVKAEKDMPHADEIFELPLTLAALNEDSSSFVYVKKLKLHYEATRDNREKAVPLIEELNELCPLDRMVLYYTLQYLVILGQKDDAEALAEGAKSYYPDDPLLKLQYSIKSVLPYPDEIVP